jgi:hypothetical protein
MRTVPLRTGPVAGANLGVVVTFRLPLLVVLCVGVLDVVADEDEPPDDELLELPQPLSRASAAHVAEIVKRLLICLRTLA